MPNPFVRRKSFARPLTARALRRRMAPSARQKGRMVTDLQRKAHQAITEDLDRRVAEQAPASRSRG